MWRTSCGDRVLGGKERTLFVHAAGCLLDHLLEEAGGGEGGSGWAWDTGVALFDRLEPKACITLLGKVVQALTDPAVPTLKLTAVNEAAVHAVFRSLRGEVALEIDSEGHWRDQEPELDGPFFLLGYDPLYWRRLVLAAYLEGRGPAPTGGGGGEEKLSPACADIEEWDLRLECLADQILWDRDWELEEIMDLPPRQARALKGRLRIDDDYYLATPGEPDDSQVRAAVAFLRQLANEDRGDQEYVLVTLGCEDDGVADLEFADAELNRQHKCPICEGQEAVCEVEVQLPLPLARDVAGLLRKIKGVEGEEGEFVEVMRAKRRVSHYLHHYLPEWLQKRFRQTFEIAPGISVERDYGTASVEFDPEKVAGVEYDEQTREQVRAATEGLEEFLLNLVMDPDYDFADPAVRQALVQTAEQLAQKFTEVEQDLKANKAPTTEEQCDRKPKEE